jgi:hypothetical protein
MSRSFGAVLLLAGASVAHVSCTNDCATYVVAIVVEDDSTGDLLCDAVVTFGTGDAGARVDASTASSDAEVPSSSSACQWDVVTLGGTYTVTASAPGFKPGTATVQLSTDECGTATAPVTVFLVRS